MNKWRDEETFDKINADDHNFNKVEKKWTSDKQDWSIVYSMPGTTLVERRKSSPRLWHTDRAFG
jgi:hypothetical protein